MGIIRRSEEYGGPDYMVAKSSFDVFVNLSFRVLAAYFWLPTNNLPAQVTCEGNNNTLLTVLLFGGTSTTLLRLLYLEYCGGNVFPAAK